MVTKEKAKQVENLIDEIARSEAVVFSDYAGFTVTEMTELRRKLSELGAVLQVTKNSLLKLALEKGGLPLPRELTGPTATLFSGEADPIESIKTLASFIKEKGKGEVKSGFFEKAFVAAEEVGALASLPGKKVLQAQLVNRLAAPIYNLAYVLGNGPQKLVSVLDQITKQRGGGTE
ncbi:MAG: 50S ribosomal protein L10 [Patescibacteria group bacterium]|nr:MAG: 50S ribosomal protein L10 [Patescibacteria group bacterium]